MSTIDKIAQHISLLDRKKTTHYLLFFLCFCFVSVGGAIYWLTAQHSNKVVRLKKLYDLTGRANKIMRESEKIQQEEERIRELLAQNKNFSIKSYFEQFCREHSITPEPNWDTEIRPIEGNETFDEIILPVTFNNQTMQKLVVILDALDKNEIVYPKELDIRATKDKKISFNMIIATKKHKHFWDD